MKIREIHVDGFGVFSGYSLTGIGPGVNVIFGENETGKSTLIKFIRFTLFGYPRSEEDRMAPPNGGPHGGRLVVETAAGVFTLERRSGPNGGPFKITPGVPKSKILGSASRDLFNSVYSFSLDELVGLESLKASGVEDRIFSTGLGLGSRSVKEIAASLKSSADSLYRLNGRAHQVSGLVDEIAALDERVTEIQAHLPLYRELAKDIAELERNTARIDCEIEALRAELKRTEVLLNCVPFHLEISGAERDLGSVRKIEGLPEDIEDRYHDLIRKRLEKAEELKAMFEGSGESIGINRLVDKVGSFTANRELLDSAARVEFLRGNLEAYLQNLKRRDEDLERAGEIEEQVRRSIAGISPNWTEEDLDLVGGDVVVVDRLEGFRDGFADIEEALLRLEADQDADARRAPKFSMRVLLITIAAVLAIAAVPLFLSGYGVWAGASLVAALAVLVGSFLVDSYLGGSQLTERLHYIKRRRLQPLRSSYIAYLRVNLKLSPELSPERALEVVKEASRLQDALYDCRRIRARTAERLEPAIERFESETEELSRIAGVENGTDTAAKARAVIDAFDRERGRSDEQKRLTERLEDLEARADAIVGNVAGIESAIGMLFSEAGALNEEDFLSRISDHERGRMLRRKIESARASVAKTTGHHDRVDDVLAELTRSDKTELELRIERISGKLAELEDSKGKNKEELGKKRQKMSDIEEESELTGLLMNLETERNRLRIAYEKWLANRVALKLLSRAKERYEREKQPAVIRNSGRHFRSITRGAYERIGVSVEEGTVTVYDDRHAAKSIDQLSRGTKEQLLISLRLGFIEEYERESEPLPVIVDDVFVNFDDRRACEAARVFREFANGDGLPAEGIRSSATASFAGSVGERSVSPGSILGRQGRAGNPGRQVLIFTCHPRTRKIFGDKNVNLIRVDRWPDGV